MALFEYSKYTNSLFSEVLTDKVFTIAIIIEAKQKARKIAAVSCYGYTTARLQNSQRATAT